jgi:hypothetical protein
MGLFDIFSTSDQDKAARDQVAGINNGLNALNNYFGQGQNALTTNYTAGLQPFLQNYAAAQPGVTMYGNALGLNGAQGSKAALDAFQNSNPGYQFALQQGENAILANQAKSGQLASGKTNLDLLNYGQGLANQSYGQWVSGLAPFLNQANTAASGAGSLYSGLGNALNTSFTNQGNANYGAQTSIGNANANADLAGLNQSANLLGLGAGLLGLGTGGAGLAGNLFNRFLARNA